MKHMDLQEVVESISMPLTDYDALTTNLRAFLDADSTHTVRMWMELLADLDWNIARRICVVKASLYDRSIGAGPIVMAGRTSEFGFTDRERWIVSHVGHVYYWKYIPVVKEHEDEDINYGTDEITERYQMGIEDP